MTPEQLQKISDDYENVSNVIKWSFVKHFNAQVDANNAESIFKENRCGYRFKVNDKDFDSWKYLDDENLLVFYENIDFDIIHYALPINMIGTEELETFVEEASARYLKALKKLEDHINDQKQIQLESQIQKDYELYLKLKERFE